jgi:exodeoxyribonuclease V alpha subunit
MNNVNGDIDTALRRLRDCGAITAFDQHFARFVARFDSGGGEALAMAAALVSRAAAEGHVCLEPHRAHETAPRLAPGITPEPGAWIASLRASAAVGAPGEYRPLILDGNRLYLHRLWSAQRHLADMLIERLDTLVPVDPASAGPLLAELFGDDHVVNWQKIAAFAALRHRLCVITGGPGAGKTTAIARILAACRRLRPGLRAMCMAPTGKAAQRMNEALAAAARSIPGLDPPAAGTIHRALGAGRAGADLDRGPRNPLATDLVIVDEASMVDLLLMRALCAALPPACTLILVGDRNQLASVDVGSVLGDLCPPGAAASFSPQFRDQFQASRGVLPRPRELRGEPRTDAIVELRTRYRFDASLAAISAAVNRGDADAALEMLQSGEHATVVWTETSDPAHAASRFAALITEGYAPYLRERDPATALAALSRFRVLCAVRGGAAGVDAVNESAERLLARAGAIHTIDRWYDHRPIMITRNDYRLELYNGDTGVILRDPATGDPRAWFPTMSGEPRSLAPARLPAHETAFAITIHKSQGSEFERTLIALPDRDTPVLSRELLYTALTRARRRAYLFGSRDVIRRGIGRATERGSGLREALWPDAPARSAAATPPRIARDHSAGEQLSLDV